MRLIFILLSLVSCIKNFESLEVKYKYSIFKNEKLIESIKQKDKNQIKKLLCSRKVSINYITKSNSKYAYPALIYVYKGRLF